MWKTAFKNLKCYGTLRQNYLVSKMLYASKLVAPPDRYDDDDDDNELFWGGLLYSGKELLLSTKDWKS